MKENQPIVGTSPSVAGRPRDLEATALVLQTVLDLLDEEGFAHLASRQANSAADSISTS